MFEKNIRTAYREEMEGILELIVQMAFADLQQANFNRTREKKREVIFLRDKKHVSLAEDDGLLSLF